MALPAAASAKPHKHVCGPPAAHHVRCHADVVTDARGNPVVNSVPSGYGPADLQSAYNLSSASSSAGGGETIAIVDAYDDPNAEVDLGVYRSQYGLPACTTANGCFRKVDQTGGTNYPSGNASWGQEISLDLDMASAICPNCKIRLVEAASNSFANLAAAVDEAAALGATQISNSYGGGEYPNEVTDQSHYNHPGIDITVSSGDNGYGVEFPASSQYVTAVGGTSLVRASNTRGWSETAWSGAGSGCSAYVSKPSWQTDMGCSRRTVADVSADADPNTGVAVYDTYGSGGWLVFGGTSVASPIIAGVDALAGGRAKAPNSYGSYPYSNAGAFYDITSGSNGSCGGSYLCTAVLGYDGPTGWGTPNGAGSAATAAPAAPTNLTATVGNAQVSLSWTGSTGATSYSVKRSTVSGGLYTTVVTGLTTPSYTNTGLTNGTTYYYVVSASNSVGESPNSNQASATPTAPAANFSLSASPSSQSIRRGHSTSYTVTITPLNGFNSAVALSVAGLPAGALASFNPSSATSSSTLTVSTSRTTPSSTYTLTITGTSGSLSYSTTVTLTVR
jgi:subtilase family serine protease